MQASPPIACDSGQHSGKRFIRAGRAHLHQARYMPGLVAIRFNADMKAKYQAFIAAGKPPKVSVVHGSAVQAHEPCRV